jgi:nitrate/nitrite transporter NarK
MLGLSVLFVLTDRPQQAAWLSGSEREWLIIAVKAHESEFATGAGTHLLHAFRSGAVWLLASIYFAISVSLYGLSLWLPVVVKSLSHAADLRVIALTAIPYLLAAVAMLLVARSSDRLHERKWHLCACLVGGALALLLSAMITNPFFAIAALFFAAAGIWGGFGPFWALPTGMLRGDAAAGGIALINSVGAVGGFCGPYLMGRVSDLTHSFRAALIVCSGLLLMAAVVAASLRQVRTAALLSH